MRPEAIVHRVFGHFQNLNLLVLLDDLRQGRTAIGDWSSGLRLCPVAHGLPFGQVVSNVRALSQAVELKRACSHAARHLGADPSDVYQFVELWDAQAFNQEWLLGQLEGIWRERLVDAEAVQEMLKEVPALSTPSRR